MRILKGRPLAFICVLSVLAMYLSAEVSNFSFVAIFIGILAIIMSATAIKFCRRKRRRAKPFRIVVTIVIFLIVSLTLSNRAFNFYNVKYSSVRESIGKECTVVGEITEVGYQNEWGARFYVDLIEINGKSVDVRAVIEIDGESVLEVGDVFSILGTPTDFTDEESYFVSDGNVIKVICENPENVSQIGYSEHKILSWFGELNHKLQRSIYHSTDEESAALISALALGNRGLLSDYVIRDFRRCGISHVLALSGMHMAIIIGFFDFLLRLLRINRKIRCFILAFISLGYLALTGFSVSACRAIIMIYMVYIGHLIWRDSDAVTSLAVAATVILFIDPYALYDVSLWMSVSATLGIVIISEIVSPLGFKIKKKPLYVQIAYKILTAVSITLAAIFFVSVFNWLCFGEISIIAPAVNLIISPIIPVLLIISLLTILSSPIPFAAQIFGGAAGYICRILLDVTEHVSNMRNITVSLRYEFVKYVAIPFIVLLILFLLCYVRRKWTIALIPTAAVIAFVILFNVHVANNKGITEVDYVRSDSSEMLVITNNDGATICDISTGGYRHLAEACEVADENCATEIENIILTHYHNYHAATLTKIADKYVVRSILLPEPETDDEWNTFNTIQTAFIDKITKIKTYRRGYSEDAGENCTINVSEKFYIKRSTHPMFLISIKLDGDSDTNELLYFSSPIFEDPYVDYPGNPDYIIVGSHGPKIYKAPKIDIIERSLPEILFLTSGESMLSDEDTIERLEALRDKYNVSIVFDRQEFNFILK